MTSKKKIKLLYPTSYTLFIEAEFGKQKHGRIFLPPLPFSPFLLSKWPFFFFHIHACMRKR